MMDPWRDDPDQEQDLSRRREEPEDAPAISAEQPSIAAGIGTAYVGRDRDVNHELDNDQDSHVSPPDNDGETVPQDEVEDQASG